MREVAGMRAKCWKSTRTESPPLAVAGSPFEVVQQRPGHGSPSPGALADGLMNRLQVLSEEVHSGPVGGWLPALSAYVVGNAVFGDHHLR